MSFEVEGKLHKKFDAENKTGTFQAREFVLEVDSGNYPQYVKFQLVQDRCAMLDDYEEGEKVKVHFDLRGREWQGKYFTNLNAWRMEKAAQAVVMPAAVSDDGSFPSSDNEPNFPAEDDLPF